MGKAIIFASDNHVTNNQKNKQMKIKNLLLVTIATLGLTASTMAQNLPNYVPTTGIVGWWPFNGNANDESGNGNNGTVNGATLTSDRFGNADKAYSFDGLNDYGILNTTLPNSFSISFWFNVDSIKTYTFQDIGSKLISTYNNSISLSGFELEIIGTPANYGLHGGAFWCNPTCESVISNSPCDTISWVFVTATFSESILKYFVNGSLVDSSISNLNNNSQLIYIAARGNNQPSFFLDGQLDDIGIWNRALTQQEISDLYNGNICYQNITVTDTLLINMGITGFNPVTYNNTIKIFPNPANNHITIDYGNFVIMNGYQLKIENSLGQQLFQTNITQQTDYLSLNNWGGNGLYFVHIIDAQGNTIDIRKIVLQ